MKLSFYSLKTRILSYLIFLIISAMLLINVVMVKFSEKDLIRAKATQGRILLQVIEQNVKHKFSSGKTALSDMVSDPHLKRYLSQLLTTAKFSQAVIVDRTGNPVFASDPFDVEPEPCLALARESLETGMENLNFSGRTWGVIWLNHRTMMVSAPLLIEGRTLAGMTVRASLSPIYRTLRRSEKVIILYILLDTIILAMVGIYLLSRMVVKPINRLLQMTEEYQEGDFIPSLGEASRNEIGNLSHSLGIMLKRLDENKRELKDHITSLENANRELQQAQDEIIRSEKLASVGRLSAGVAHEIGNPIGIVLGYLELIRKSNITEDERNDFLERIQVEITRINQIIRNLLDFSRSSTGKPEETSTHELIKSTVDILNPQPLMEGIRLSLELQASRDIILADPNQLQQVFLNIIMNAADSLVTKNQSGGRSSEKKLTLVTDNTDSSIEIGFVDNGPGILEEELVHIFDPFYTTKDPGRGTGLGLSVSYRIVESLGGTIRAKSSPGEGTAIMITLPLYRKQEEE